MSHMYAKPRAPRTVRGRLQTRYFFNQPLFCTVCIGTCAFSSFSLTVTFWDKVSINDNGIDPPSRIERAECYNERERERERTPTPPMRFQICSSSLWYIIVLLSCCLHTLSRLTSKSVL